MARHTTNKKKIKKGKKKVGNTDNNEN